MADTLQTVKITRYIVDVTADSWEGEECEMQFVFDKLPTMQDIQDECRDYQSQSVKIVSAWMETKYVITDHSEEITIA